MSDDTLNVDSAEELPTDETVGTDESASQETTDESTGDAVPSGKEKALKDTEAAIKARQAEFTKLSQQIAELKGSLTTLTQLQSQQAKQEEVKDWMEELNSDKVVEDPLAAMKFMRDQMRKEIASVLSDRDAFLLSKVGGAKIDPELQSKVDELRADPDFADLPGEKLAAIARKMVTPKRAVMTPRGSISGSGRSTPAQVKKEGELSAEETAWLRAAGVLKTNQRDDTLE
jgi:hypothetical protein